MADIRKRLGGKAGRDDSVDESVLTGRANNTNPSPVDRLPNHLREKYRADCLAFEIAARYFTEARRLLQGTQS
jgi:hypothetical protein